MTDRSKHLIAALCLAAAVVAFRLLPIYGSDNLVLATANLAPLAALALCGGLLLPRKLAMGVTFGAFIVSDIALNLHYGRPVLNGYSFVLLATYAAVFFAGWFSRRRRSLATALGGTVAGVCLFYLVTNTAAFFFDPGYTKTFAGWAQAVSIGLPGYPPTWSLGLRMLASNLLFAFAFTLAMRPAVKPDAAFATAPAA